MAPANMAAAIVPQADFRSGVLHDERGVSMPASYLSVWAWPDQRVTSSHFDIMVGSYFTDSM